MKRNPSIQVLIILMVVMFFVTGPVAAATPKPTASASKPVVSAPVPAGLNKMKAVASISEAEHQAGPDDSILVITGKIDMGGADYFEAIPDLNDNNPFGQIMGTYYIPQKKSNEAAGYKIIHVILNTGASPESWKQFKEWNQFEVRPQTRINVKTKNGSSWVPWEPTAPSLPKTYTIGPMQPK
jgi:hypothetical protein